MLSAVLVWLLCNTSVIARALDVIVATLKSSRHIDTKVTRFWNHENSILMADLHVATSVLATRDTCMVLPLL